MKYARLEYYYAATITSTFAKGLDANYLVPVWKNLFFRRSISPFQKLITISDTKYTPL